jgi:hypothetical protein
MERKGFEMGKNIVSAFNFKSLCKIIQFNEKNGEKRT